MSEIAMILAHPHGKQFHPTWYLTEEARLEREERLVARLAADPEHPDNRLVPPRIQRLVRARREASINDSRRVA